MEEEEPPRSTSRRLEGKPTHLVVFSFNSSRSLYLFSSLACEILEQTLVPHTTVCRRNLRPEHGCPKQHARERTSSLQQCFNATTPHAPAPPSGSQQLFPYWQDCPSLGGAAEPQAVTSTGSSTSSANFQKGSNSPILFVLWGKLVG